MSDSVGVVWIRGEGDLRTVSTFKREGKIPSLVGNWLGLT